MHTTYAGTDYVHKVNRSKVLQLSIHCLFSMICNSSWKLKGFYRIWSILHRTRKFSLWKYVYYYDNCTCGFICQNNVSRLAVVGLIYVFYCRFYYIWNDMTVLLILFKLVRLYDRQWYGTIPIFCFASES